MEGSINESELEQQALKKLRDAIDGIDDRLLKLINDRAELAHQVAVRPALHAPVDTGCLA